MAREYRKSSEVSTEIRAAIKKAWEDGIAFNVGSNEANPTYELLPIGAVEPNVAVNAVAVGIDEVKRNFSLIRNLARFRQLTFVIVDDGRMKVIFRRHPDFRSAREEKYLNAAGNESDRENLRAQTQAITRAAPTRKKTAVKKKSRG